MDERKIEVSRDDKWVEVQMKDIRKGEKFRMFEPDGKPVVGQGEFKGKTVFKAEEDPYEVDGTWGVKGGHVED